MKELRVIFLEQDAALAQRLKPYYGDLLAECGYSVEFFDARGESDARALVLSQDIHVLICDLGYEKEYVGLHTIRTIRTEYPDVFVIGTSRADYSPHNVDNRQPSFELFINKQALLGNDKRYRALTQKRFRDAFRLETGVQISNLDSLSSNEFRTPEAKRELLALVRQILFADHSSDDLLHPDEVFLEPMTGGFSGSQVFRMVARNKKSGIVSVPSVLKVSRREYATAELQNYHRFVKWGLPYTWRVDLLGHGSSKEYGGVAYSFILSGLKKFESLTELFRRKEDGVALRVIGTLFDPDKRRWYGDSLIRSETNIVARYTNRYFRDADSKDISERLFLSTALSEFKARLREPRIEIEGASYELPLPALFGSPIDEYNSCICHGDMNSNNVMIAENGEIILIDFQETGRGHVFEDFVTMEACARLYYGDAGLRGIHLLKAERGVRDGDDVSGLVGPQLIAAEIRRLARANFPAEDFRTYYYASAAFAFRLLRVKSLSAGQVERLVAMTLASLHDLANSGTGK